MDFHSLHNLRISIPWYDESVIRRQTTPPRSLQGTDQETSRYDLLLRRDQVVGRRAWGARPPRRPEPTMDGVISHVIFVYADTPACRSPEQCVQTVQRLQGYHMDHGQADIPYSFLLGDDDRLYVGRGWRTTPPIPEDVQVHPLRTLVVARMGPVTGGFQKDFQLGHNLVHFCFEEAMHTADIQTLLLRDWNVYPSGSDSLPSSEPKLALASTTRVLEETKSNA